MNHTSTASKTPLYQSGFGNHFQSEAVAGALPRDQNSPQLAPLGLYPEQFSATAFTVPRVENRFSWLYRIRPAAMHTPFERLPHAALDAAREGRSPTSPSQLRWGSLAMPTEATDFIQGLVVYATSPEGMVMLYAANADMQSRYCYSSDGEWLIVPQAGRLRIATEFGVMEVSPLHIAVIPRGVRFCVSLPDGAARGYICENAGQLFRLPDLGPIGANGLAHARHFESPVADFEDVDRECEIIAKHDGVLWRAGQNHSPLDVVAWHGTLAPYRYDLTRFNTINTVSYDHPDPSIFTVLTSPSGHQGTANIDFVIFPPRWMVAENTFRPPYFHRNVMSEFMGLITGVYDAKEEGFVPGGASLHNRMSAHGPDVSTYEKASAATLAPHKIDGTMAFMFETCHLWRPTEYAVNAPQLQASYSQCWQGFRRGFAKSSSVTGLNH